MLLRDNQRAERVILPSKDDQVPQQNFTEISKYRDTEHAPYSSFLRSSKDQIPGAASLVDFMTQTKASAGPYGCMRPEHDLGEQLVIAHVSRDTPGSSGSGWEGHLLQTSSLPDMNAHTHLFSESHDGQSVLRLVIANALSPATVELLGSSFRLDPRVFLHN